MATLAPDLDQDSYLEDMECGKMFLFWNEAFGDNMVLKFSSTIDNVGNTAKHDRFLKNKTLVIALSEPTEAYHLTRGPMLVTKIMAHEIMWVCTWHLKAVKAE